MFGFSRLYKITAADLIVRTAYQMGKTPLLPIFAASLGANATFLGLIVSVSTITGMLLKPIFGLLSDRWGRWIWLFVGTIIFSGIPFLYHWTSTPEELLILRLIHGLSTAIYGPVTVAFVIESCRGSGVIDNNCAERLGWFGIARSGGYLLGPTITAFLLTEYAPQTIFTFIGIFSSCAFFPILLLKDYNPYSLKKTFKIHTKEAFFSGIKTPELWLAGSLECIVYLGFFASKTFLPLYAIETGITIIWVGIFFSTQELIHLITRPLGGRLSDRFGYLLIIASGMLVAASSFGLLPMIDNPYTMLMLAITLGLSQSMIFPSTLALFSQKVDKQYVGTGIGMIGTFKNLGKVIGPLLGGLIIHLHNYNWMFWSISILLSVWSLGLLLNSLNLKTDIRLDGSGKTISINV